MASKPSLAEIKAAGRARKKAAQQALAAEEVAISSADQLWAAAFDVVHDSASMGAAAEPASWASVPAGGTTVLVLVPGFSSWGALTEQHVARWRDAAVLPRSAISIAFKWPCGNVRWSGEDAYVEAAAAWQGAHEAAPAAAASLARLLAGLDRLGCHTVVAAHSLGARVALAACTLSGCGRLGALFLVGAAVDNSVLGSPIGPAEFPLGALAVTCPALTLVHSSRDPTLVRLYPAAEYARSGRVAAPALGAGGLASPPTPPADGGASPLVNEIDVTDAVDDHDPMAYVNAPRSSNLRPPAMQTRTAPQQRAFLFQRLNTAFMPFLPQLPDPSASLRPSSDI